MTLTCNCDMPPEIYWDWLQDQGWNCDEMRQEGDPVVSWDSPYDTYWSTSFAVSMGHAGGYGNGEGDGYCYLMGCPYPHLGNADRYGYPHV